MSATELPLGHHDRCPDCGSAISAVTVEQPSLLTDNDTTRSRLRSCLCGWSTTDDLTTTKEAT